MGVLCNSDDVIIDDVISSVLVVVLSFSTVNTYLTSNKPETELIFFILNSREK